jgi:hypothetical protein
MRAAELILKSPKSNQSVRDKLIGTAGKDEFARVISESKQPNAFGEELFGKGLVPELEENEISPNF